MANTKITELTALTQCAATDVLPIVKVSANTTKKVSISDLLRNAPAGTAGAPSIANADDQDTGILFPAANSIGVSTGGTQRLVIDSSGNVGIGQSSPVVALQVSGASAARIQLSTDNTGHTATDGVRIQVDSSNNLELLQRESANIEFFTAGTERLRIDSSGNVGIGTTSPSAPLTVFGGSASSPTIRIEGGSSGNDNARIESEYNLVLACNGDGDQSDRKIQFRNNATDLVTIDSSGNVGIGETSPNKNLVVKKANGGGDVGIRIQNDSTNSSGTTASLRFTTSTNDSFDTGSIVVDRGTGAMIFSEGEVEAMRINNSGNVGIGQSSPSGRLEVNGGYVTLRSGASSFPDGISAPVIYGSTGGGSGTFNETGNLVLQSRSDAGSYNICMVTGDTPAERMRIDSSGNVGIGTSSPGAPLDVNGAIHSRSSGIFADNLSAYSGSSISVNAGSSNLNVVVGGSERVRIDSSGQVGIGLTSPGAPLAVASSGGINAKLVGRDNGTVDEAQLYFMHNDNSTVHGIIEGKSTSLNLYGGTTLAQTIDSSGRVGIGTASPATKLTIVDTDGSITFGNSSSDEHKLSWNEGSIIVEADPANLNSSSTIQFKVDASERMRIDSSGNVGIGSTNPAAFGKFVVQGTGNLINLNATSGAAKQGFYENGTGRFYLSTLNGSNGLAFVAADGSTERMRIDSSGQIGIGETTPLGKLHVKSGDSGASSVGASADEFVIENSGHAGMTILSGTDQQGIINFADPADVNVGGFTYSHSDNSMVFRVNDSERMRITSGGVVAVNRTTAIHGGVFVLDYTNGTTAGLAIKDTRTTGTGVVLHVVNGSGTVVGGISQNQSTTSFNTSSDYRLKENVVDITDGIARVKQLQPRRFNFIANDTTTVDGFVAHEAQTVVPEAVTGTHNEVDDDNNPVYQAIDQSKLVPLLTAALQEAIAKIETLEAKVAALEAQ